MFARLRGQTAFQECVRRSADQHVFFQLPLRAWVGLVQAAGVQPRDLDGSVNSWHSNSLQGRERHDVAGSPHREGLTGWGFGQQSKGLTATSQGQPRKPRESTAAAPRNGANDKLDALDAAALTRAFAASIGSRAAKRRESDWAGGGVTGVVGFGGGQKWGKRVRQDNARRWERRQRLRSQEQGKHGTGSPQRPPAATVAPRGEQIVVEPLVPGDLLTRDHEILSSRFGIHSLHMRPQKGVVARWRMGEIQKRRLLATEGKPQPLVYYQTPVDVIDDTSLSRKLGVAEGDILRLRQRARGSSQDKLRPMWGRPPVHRRGRESQVPLSDIPSWGWAPYGLRPRTWRQVILRREQVKLGEPLPPHAQERPPDHPAANADVNKRLSRCARPADVLAVLRAAQAAQLPLTKANCLFALRRMHEMWPQPASHRGGTATAGIEPVLDGVLGRMPGFVPLCVPVDSDALMNLLRQLCSLMDFHPHHFSRTDVEELVASLGTLSTVMPVARDLFDITRSRAENLMAATREVV